MPNKFPPLHFVPNGMNRVPSTMNKEDTSWTILPTYQVTPTIIREKRRGSTSNKFNPLGGFRRRPNALPAIIQLNLASLPKLESMIIMSLKNSTKGPKGCQLSNHSEMFAHLNHR
jgi:hypothetical protein